MAESSKQLSPSVRTRSANERSLRFTLATDAPPLLRHWTGACRLASPRRSHIGVFGYLMVVTLLAASGCASITSKLDVLPKLVASSKRSVKPSQHQPMLGNPENRSAQIALETARLAEERAMDAEAIASYEEVRRLDPKQPGVAHALAVLYDRAAMTDAAQREYAAALQESPGDVNVHCDYGYFLYSTGDLAGAEQSLRRGLDIDANHEKTIINLAVVLATRREYEESKSLFERAIGPAAALHNIGIFKLRQGDAAEGESMIAAALQKDPSLRQSKAVLDNVADPVGKPYLASQTEELQR